MTTEAITRELAPSQQMDQIDEAIAQLIEGDFHSRWDQAKQFSKKFASWGDRVVPALINQLNIQQDPDAQWFLVRMLSQFDRPEVVSAIANLLVTTQNEDVKLEASKALTALGSSTITTLTELLTTAGPIAQRRLAASALSHIRRGATIEPLLSIANDPDPELRAISTEALGSFHSPKVTPVLLAALSDQPAICTEAIRALSRRRDLLETTDLTQQLSTCLHSEDVKVACESAKALGRLGHESAAILLGDLLVQPVATPVKVSAVRALSWIANATAVSALVSALECDALQVAPSVVQEIARALGQARTPELQQQAANALVTQLQMLSPAIAPIASANRVHDAAVEESAVPTFMADYDLFGLKQAIISALAQLKQSEAIDSLIPFLADAEPRIKMHALSALTQIDSKASQVMIQVYLADENIDLTTKRLVAESLSAW